MATSREAQIHSDARPLVDELVDTLTAGEDWLAALEALQAALPGATWAPGESFTNDLSQLKLTIRGVCELLEGQRIQPDEGAALLQALLEERPAVQDFSLPEDRYETGDLLGMGGMGEVRAVHDRRLGRTVAIKRLLAPSSSRSTASSRKPASPHSWNTPISFRSTTFASRTAPPCWPCARSAE
ncbi:MAG TPA: hypothetical protein QGF58_15360 [Myxococcota bacterium]|nr:hypothetical protein [Myxococcota bacterium]